MRGGATFVPLTLSAAATVAAEEDCLLARPGETSEVRAGAAAADAEAAECWTMLLAGCDGNRASALPARLRELVEAAANYAGPAWWFSDGSPHRGRVTDAQLRIEEAVREGDGEDFAEAFVCFDHALATALVCAPRRAAGPAHLPLPRA